jgi:hypothetical protein
MLIFIDESFRVSKSTTDKSVGALGGIGIPEEDFDMVVREIFQLKTLHFGYSKAKSIELKSKILFKPQLFKTYPAGTVLPPYLEFANDLLQYIIAKKLFLFGSVCFEDSLSNFSCQDVCALDKTFVFLFERIHEFLKREYPRKKAKIIFDDRGYTVNKLNAEAITNFFVRSPIGLAMSNIIKTPFFSISQAQNIGLQLSDIIAGILSLKFAGEPRIEHHWKIMKTGLYRWEKELKDGTKIKATSLKVLK